MGKLSKVIIVLLVLAVSTAIFFWSSEIPLEPKSKIHPVVKVTIEGQEHGHSSAVHIGGGFFLGALHTIKDGQSALFTINERKRPVKAEVLWAAKNYDIVFLSAPELSHLDSYPLSCEPLYVGQELEFHGNPSSLNSISTYGRVAGKEFSTTVDYAKVNWDSIVPVDAVIIPGMSGGSAINTNKELAGINVGTMIINIGPMSASLTSLSYIVPSSTICRLFRL